MRRAELLKTRALGTRSRVLGAFAVAVALSACQLIEEPHQLRAAAELDVELAQTVYSQGDLVKAAIRIGSPQQLTVTELRGAVFKRPLSTGASAVWRSEPQLINVALGAGERRTVELVWDRSTPSESMAAPGAYVFVVEAQVRVVGSSSADELRAEVAFELRE